jgi:DNA repair ATPase RecN
VAKSSSQDLEIKRLLN